ncbi:metal-dependent hydrolase [Natrinema halophilum]|uniref:Metal-dependent hydrolase n=1 Tax=Natrinema halophilum TaxID=1699371 RepID=A0A7D5GTQ4_9EURY|nr:metal-dependent hydrolase [Natrinema halophilum]QLG50289.1 metal-dependent hydrolase [Natrinema halophilum]
MHREGHLGIGLLLYSPISYLLLISDAQMGWGLGLAAVCFWGFAPDLDLKLPIKHRGPTHTIWAAIGTGLITAIVAIGFLILGVPDTQSISIFVAWIVLAFFIGALGVVGHLLGDAITPMMIRPLRPYSDKKCGLNLTKAKNETANQALLVTGAGFLTGSIFLSI